jgi:hypothetical protein
MNDRSQEIDEAAQRTQDIRRQAAERVQRARERVAEASSSLGKALEELEIGLALIETLNRDGVVKL